MNNVFGEYFFSYASDTALRRAVKFVRTSITYTPKSTTSCNDNCGLAYDCAGSPVPNCRPCWGSGDDGTYCCGGICCGGSRGQTCSTTTTNVKDPVPAGYAERYGEWVKIDNPVQTQAVEEPVGFSLSKVEWEPDYYQAVDLPTPHPAEVYDEATGAPTGAPVGMSDPTTPQGGFLNNGPFVNPYLVATGYELKGLQPDRTGQNPFARPGPNTVSMQANETIVGPKDGLSQRYYAPQDAKYAEGGEVKKPGYFDKTADENYDIKDYLLDTIPKGISKYLLLNPYEGLDRQVGEELAGYVDTRMENYRARELQERLDRLYEGMTPEEIEAYKLAFTKNVGSSAP